MVAQLNTNSISAFCELCSTSLNTPEANLACDEVLLNRVEEAGEGILRFWESEQYFVVVGYSNEIETEVNVSACREMGVPIFRRLTGGGTVVQGPGCLNYSLVLPIESDDRLRDVTSTNRWIMEQNREAIAKCFSMPGLTSLSRGRVNEGEGETANPESPKSTTPFTLNNPAARRLSSLNKIALTPDPSPPRRGEPEPPLSFDSGAAASPYQPTVTVEGITDLALNGLKFSGNAQRRKRRSVLFHGTFLYDFDLTLVEKLLRFPSKQPDYRGSRSHADFLTNLPLDVASIKEVLRKQWNANMELDFQLENEVRELAAAKYSRADWTEQRKC